MFNIVKLRNTCMKEKMIIVRSSRGHPFQRTQIDTEKNIRYFITENGGMK